MLLFGIGLASFLLKHVLKIGESGMKKLVFILGFVFLVPQYGALAHQESHIHSQWVKQELNQLRQTIQQLKSRIEGMQGGGAQSSVGGPRAISGMALNETCGPNQQKLCSKSCGPGSKITKATCIGKGNIGKTYHSDQGVTCYCYNEKDPNCRVERITASCAR